MKWIESPKGMVAAAGWATLRGLVSIKGDADLDLPALKQLLQRMQKTIHQSPDFVRYQMNSFVISVGGYVQPLTEFAHHLGEKIGPVTCDLGDNGCQTPFIPDYIHKVQQRGTIGKKRESVKC